MDEPTYRIFYGQYLDHLDTEIPTAHIIDVSGISLRIDPGLPGEPKADTMSFVLANLSPDTGVERYDDAWFDAESRSAEDGATMPLQLFFRVELGSIPEIGFTGIVKSKSYASRRESVTVVIASPLEFISKSTARVYGRFDLGSLEVSTITAGPDGKDLDNVDIDTDSIRFPLAYLRRRSVDPHVPIGNAFINHLGFADTDDLPASAGTHTIVANRNFWIRIGETTMLTQASVTVFRSIVADGIFPWDIHGYTVFLNVLHADNGNYAAGDKTVLERGRYFADDKGTQLSAGDMVDVIVFDHDITGDDPNILLKGSKIHSTPAKFIHGAMANLSASPFEIIGSAPDGTPAQPWMQGDYFDVFAKTVFLLNGNLLATYYDDPEDVVLIESAKAPTANRFVFWPDAIMYGWLDKAPADIIVNLAQQFNCYLFINEAGKIVFQDRLWHSAFLPDDLPTGAIQVLVRDIDPIGGFTEADGFDAYALSVRDRIEINNVEASKENRIQVDKDGLRTALALRTTSLELTNHRTGDLGVPNMDDPIAQHVFRFSPDSPSFPVGGVDLDDFIPTAIQVATRFAQSWTYPVRMWSISLDLNRYPGLRLGGYIWIQTGTDKVVWLIRSIHYRSNLRAAMEIQRIGVWNDE